MADPAPVPGEAAHDAASGPVGSAQVDMSRRRLLVGAGSVLGPSMAMAAGGRFMLERTKRVLAGRETVVLPQVTETTAATAGTSTTSPATTAGEAPVTTTEVTATTEAAATTTTSEAAVEGAGPLPAGHSLDVAGISPIITPNEDFYLIDIASPRLRSTWRSGPCG